MSTAPPATPSSCSPHYPRFGSLALILVAVTARSALAKPGEVGHPSAVKGPYVTSVSETTATVRFELAEAASATVELALDGVSAQHGVAPQRFDSAGAATMHVVSATGLAPSSRYAYAVRVAGAVVATGHLLTAPPATSTAAQSFLVYGDDRTDDDAHAAVVRALEAAPSDFLVNTGDMVADGGSAANWAAFFAIERDLLRERPLFSALGNHELYDDLAGANFARYFGFADASGVTRPYGTLRYGSARFFFLNGMLDWDVGPDRAWLESALSTADNEPGLVWRFAVVHHGPWSAGPHGPNARLVEAHVPELLAAHKVDLVLSGHDHIYERGDAGRLKYLVSGGGGAPLYRDLHRTATTRKAEATYHFVEITTHGDALELVAHRIDGSLLDRCGFIKGAAWDCDPPAAARAASPAPSSDSTAPLPPSHDIASAPRSSACSCDVAGEGEASRRAPWGVLMSLVLGLLARRAAGPRTADGASGRGP